MFDLMMQMTTRLMTLSTTALLAAAGFLAADANGQSDVETVLNKINPPIMEVSEGNKSYKVLFDAALVMHNGQAAPTTTGWADAKFNVNTIHPGMSNWQAVRDWAESNPQMRQAILQVKDRVLIGLPYGREIDAKYLSGGMYADIAVDGNLRDQDFAYLKVMDTIAAFGVADAYSLLEAGRGQDAINVALGTIYVIDQFCERLFMTEKLHAMQMQIDFLASLRDMMFLHEDVLSMDQLASPGYELSSGEKMKGVAFELPWLRIDLMGMPTGDYDVAEQLLHAVFDGDEPDPIEFVEVFAALQAREKPFTQFGAAKRWGMVSAFHASRIDSHERLKLVFDDWWRRWGVREWHEILNIKPQYDRTNPIRFAAVMFAMKDISAIFPKRRQLMTAANATSVAAALLAYKKRHGTYPTDLEKIYATHLRKRFDVDPFDKSGAPFGYRFIPESAPVNIITQNLGFVPVTGALLWSRGQDFESQRGESHSDDGLEGDIVFWPPLRAIARKSGE